jgi:arylsulfatase A-like enzyme
MRPALILLLFALSACGADPQPQTSSYAPDGSLAEAPANLRPHNVLLVSIDTLRADHLGCYGHSAPTSPQLDALAAAGVVFERATSCSPWTTPAHVSLMTSLYPEAHGILDYPSPGELDPKVATLAEILRAQGWRTAGFTEGGYAKGATGLGHGFDVFPSWPHDDAGFIGHELDPSRLLENADRALAWLDEHGRERFFLFFHTYEPHFEYRPPHKYLAQVAPSLDLKEEALKLSLAVHAWNQGRTLSPRQLGVLTRHTFQGGLRRMRFERSEALWATLGHFAENAWRDSPHFGEDLAYIGALYDAEIRFADDVVGRIFAKLEKLGVMEETLIVVTSDHGEGLMDHDEMQHGFHLYRELLDIPLIIRFPGRAHAGARHPGQVRSIDILPTVLDWIGLPQPATAQGSSLLTLLSDDTQEDQQGSSEWRVAFAEGLTIEGSEVDLRMIQDGRWKFLQNSKTGGESLYDLASDPRELRDVLSKVDPKVVAQLRLILDRVVAENAERASLFHVTPGRMNEQERRRLEALGYVQGDARENDGGDPQGN